MNSSISHLVIELSRMNGTISHSIISYLLASYFVILDGVADTAHQFRDLPASYVCEILLCPLSCMQFYIHSLVLHTLAFGYGWTM
jgi:hypothetical protein